MSWQSVICLACVVRKITFLVKERKETSQSPCVKKRSWKKLSSSCELLWAHNATKWGQDSEKFQLVKKTWFFGIGYSAPCAEQGKVDSQYKRVRDTKAWWTTFSKMTFHCEHNYVYLTSLFHPVSVDRQKLTLVCWLSFWNLVRGYPSLMGAWGTWKAWPGLLKIIILVNF